VPKLDTISMYQIKLNALCIKRKNSGDEGAGAEGDEREPHIPNIIHILHGRYE
jgi:hypothetical protein